MLKTYIFLSLWVVFVFLKHIFIDIVIFLWLPHTLLANTTSKMHPPRPFIFRKYVLFVVASSYRLILKFFLYQWMSVAFILVVYYWKSWIDIAGKKCEEKQLLQHDLSTKTSDYTLCHSLECSYVVSILLVSEIQTRNTIRCDVLARD